MAQTFPTKANLLSTKKSLELAKTGYELMDSKRNILLREMLRMLEESKQIRQQLSEAYAEAYESLAMATLGLGDCSRFAEMIPAYDGVRVYEKSIMGVEVPVVENEESVIDVRYFGFDGTSEWLDEACNRFNKVKMLAVQLSETENSICRLADAVKKTQKRSNALSNIIIPKFESTIRNITQVLDEKEREDFSRLKVTKKVTQTKR